MRAGCSSRLILIIGIVLLVLFLAGVMLGAIGSTFLDREAFASAPKPELPPEAIVHAGPVIITNTMITAWVTIIVLGLFFWAATRKMRLVPRGIQNFAEFIIESLVNFVNGVAGPEKGRRFFPIIATIFLFVIANAWLGLVPFYGSFGVHEELHGESVLVPILRPANTDLNFTLALALISFVFVEYFGVKYHGFFRYSKKFIRLGGVLGGLKAIVTGKVGKGLSALLTGVIDLFVGAIEAFSELTRIISFTFRLFGNMTAGEILLFLMFFLVPFTVPVIFYGLEVIVGLVQALIFGGLTLVFVTVATAEEH